MLQMGDMRTISFRASHLKRICAIGLVGVVIVWFSYRQLSGIHQHGMAAQNREPLSFSKGHFVLDGKPLRILSGAMHYFRVVPEYWRDRLMKMQACGLNTVETYVSWNLHEPVPGQFDFEGMLNIRAFIQLAQEVGLHVILRPGPYICSEWDFGGLPSWLLADPEMRVRTNYRPYQDAVDRFFYHLLPLVSDLQYSKGGPIIAIQVENEYGSYSNEVDHLAFIKNTMIKYGLSDFFVTSDNDAGMTRAPFYEEALPTANFKDVDKGLLIFKHIRDLNPEHPLMVMEFWSGWFDHWGKNHEIFAVPAYEKAVRGIMDAGASINFYMFHGGTNFGFMNGANQFDEYKPDVTSYDYDAPLSEAGDITEKFEKTRQILLQKALTPIGVTELPSVPPNTPKAGYGSVKVQNVLQWEDMLAELDYAALTAPVPVYMEMLKLETGIGQQYGYIVYQKTLKQGAVLTLPGKMRDWAQVLVDGKEVASLDWKQENPSVELPKRDSSTEFTLDIVVENMGRVNYALAGSNILNEQRKGLSGNVMLDQKVLNDWKIYPMEFPKKYLVRLEASAHWQAAGSASKGTGMYRATLDISGSPKDTFLNMKGWKKGVVFVNFFNLGRYWEVGPQATLYIPAPILRTGQNTILIFEQRAGSSSILFQDTPILG